MNSARVGGNWWLNPIRISRPLLHSIDRDPAIRRSADGAALAVSNQIRQFVAERTEPRHEFADSQNENRTSRLQPTGQFASRNRRCAQLLPAFFARGAGLSMSWL